MGCNFQLRNGNCSSIYSSNHLSNYSSLYSSIHPSECCECPSTVPCTWAGSASATARLRPRWPPAVGRRGGLSDHRGVADAPGWAVPPMPSASALFSPPPPVWKSWDFLKKNCYNEIILKKYFFKSGWRRRTRPFRAGADGPLRLPQPAEGGPAIHLGWKSSPSAWPRGGGTLMCAALWSFSQAVSDSSSPNLHEVSWTEHLADWPRDVTFDASIVSSSVRWQSNCSSGAANWFEVGLLVWLPHSYLGLGVRVCQCLRRKRRNYLRTCELERFAFCFGAGAVPLLVASWGIWWMSCNSLASKAVSLGFVFFQ
jgi:hypothetical protein